MSRWIMAMVPKPSVRCFLFNWLVKKIIFETLGYIETFFCSHFQRKLGGLLNYSFDFIVPTPLEGGRTIYTNRFFFVQSILGDRYIHRIELRLVSLESLSSVEYAIKNIFWFSFLTRSYRALNFWEIEWIPFILFTFSGIFEWQKFLNWFLKTKILSDTFIEVFCQKFWLNISKFRLFHQKQHEISFFSPLWLNMQEAHTPTPLTLSL